jgi:phosphoglycolate phosphatase
LYKLAIFDFDGTLVDSAPGIVDVMRECCLEYDFSPKTLELWSHLIGIPLLRQVEILFPDNKHEFHEEVAQRYRDIYDTRAIEICPPFDGLEEMLRSLRKAEILISIASSKRRHLIDTVLEYHKLVDYFSLVVGAEEVKKHKPDPEMVLYSTSKLGIPLAESVVIGDSSFDLDMARNAGCDAIGVTTGIHTREILSKSEPKHIVTKLGEVLPLILNGK